MPSIVVYFWTAKFANHEGQMIVAADPKSVTYIVDGRPIALVNDISEVEPAPGSADKIVTRYFGNEIYKDLDGRRPRGCRFSCDARDGREQDVFLCGCGAK